MGRASGLARVEERQIARAEMSGAGRPDHRRLEALDRPWRR